MLVTPADPPARVPLVADAMVVVRWSLSAEKEAEEELAALPLTSLGQFKVGRVLDASPAAKTAAVLGSFAGKEVRADALAHILRGKEGDADGDGDRERDGEGGRGRGKGRRRWAMFAPRDWLASKAHVLPSGACAV